LHRAFCLFPQHPSPSFCSPQHVIISCNRGGAAADGEDDAHIVPGYIDWQINGCYGIDFSADDSGLSLTQGVASAAKLLPRHGVTAFCPTVVTCPPEVYARCLPHFSPSSGSAASGAHVLGLHLEGPVLSPSKAGAHRLQLLRTPVPGSRSPQQHQQPNPKPLTLLLPFLAARSSTFTEAPPPTPSPSSLSAATRTAATSSSST
jgi:N-acetylglucosamine-6-phosphate deacetylase